ncbi:MAG: hypothetical protein ACRD5B_19495 [Nitrososphaeraceae archaeon]
MPLVEEDKDKDCHSQYRLVYTVLVVYPTVCDVAAVLVSLDSLQEILIDLVFWAKQHRKDVCQK